MQTAKRFQAKLETYFQLSDYYLLIPVLVMTIMGLYVLNQVLLDGYGAGAWPGNFIKQLGAALVGVLIALLISLLEPPTLKLLAWLVYGVSIMLLLYAKIDGYSLRGATGADSWIRLPFIGSFQPSELAKVGIALTSATYFARLKQGQGQTARNILYIALIYLIPLFLIYKEPDFGTAFVIVIMFFTTLFIWGVAWRYLITFALGACALLPLLWFFYFDPYQKGRILALFFPSQDIAETYHVEQALKAVVAGGISGNRTGVSVPVPVKESDFIFSAISEYLGFLGTFLLITLIAVFIARSFYLAYKTAQYELESSYTVVALVAAMSFHFIENMGMNVGLLPITGIPLPFMSNGGTSMLVNYLALGILLNISLNWSLRQQSFSP